jgi:hypothetical protein
MSDFIVDHELEFSVGRMSNLSLPLSPNYPRIYKIFIKAHSSLLHNNAVDL